MARNEDTAAVVRKRQREARTISQMVALYCAGNHGGDAREHVAACGEPVCSVCKELDDYANLRTMRCPRMECKTSCDGCPHPCYHPAMRERIRTVMRYAGPRMLTSHPVAAMRHLCARLAAKRMEAKAKAAPERQAGA